jgi:hypothetical protein
MFCEFRPSTFAQGVPSAVEGRELRVDRRDQCSAGAITAGTGARRRDWNQFCACAM